MRTFALALTLTFGVFTSACDKPPAEGSDSKPPPAQGCTEEAKLCPDGSSVARVWPDCEFAPCPGEGAGEAGEASGEAGGGEAGDEVMCTMDAKICPDGTGVGRVPPDCEFAPCPGE